MPFAVASVMEKQQSETVVGITTVSLFAGMLAATSVLTWYVNKIIHAQNVAFYKENYPFDLADLSF